MEYTLMHKNIPVLDLAISEYSGNIEKHGAVHNAAHLPFGTTAVSGKDTGSIVPFQLNQWWVGRSIPASRAGLTDVLQVLGIGAPVALVEKCYGLSLSDQYWICPKGSGMRWESVNFFHNDFSKDMGEILFGHEPKNLNRVNFMSPDNTSDGWLRKKWVIADGKRYLMKGGSGVYQQEPYNEVIASAVMRRLGIPHIPYTLTYDGDKPYSLCENFVTPDTELISAHRVREAVKRDNRQSGYSQLLHCCDVLGISNVRTALDKMLVVDYIIANEDRHYNNFGFIRNAETLEWIGFSPVYDCGTSLWYDVPFVGRDMGCKPFRPNHAEQIKLVSDWSWFNPDALRGIGEEVNEILSSSERVEDKRRMMIAAEVTDRCSAIVKIARGKKSVLANLHEKQQIVDASRKPKISKRETER